MRPHMVTKIRCVWTKHFHWVISLPPATKLGQGYIFTGVCDSVHRGACMVAGGGHVWLLVGGMHGCSGPCMVAGGPESCIASLVF